MGRTKVFLVTLVAGCFGGALGGLVGSRLGPGGLIAGAVLVGAMLVAAAGYRAADRRWIAIDQRPWVIAGGELGYGVACLVVLSTLGSNGPLAASLLVGVGAVLGTVLGPTPQRSRGRRASDAGL
jgi:hypothetical protein